MILKDEIIDAIYQAFHEDTQTCAHMSFGASRVGGIDTFKREGGKVTIKGENEEVIHTDLESLEVDRLIFILRRIEKKEYKPINE
jgi:hypothetical protein